MSRYRFPPSLPRKMYWSDAVGGRSSCPDCHTNLKSEHHAYVMATRRAGSVDLHMVGNAAGHFCGNCAVVVLDRDEFERFVGLAVVDTEGVSYVVMGIVDLDAVPEDKSGLPFDEDTNPIPIVEFTNLGKKKASESSRHSPRSGKKEKRRNKRKNRRR